MRVITQQLHARHPTASRDAALALKSISVRIDSGEQVAVIGPSGSGKTTFLYVLACAMQPVSGSVQLDQGNPWQLSSGDLHRLRQRLFLAPQMPPLPPRQRVVTAVLAGRLPRQSLWASLRSLFYPSDIPAAHAALEQLDLSEKIFDRVDRLSGGERQRVGLARALIARPDLWLIDEPLSALDPSRAELALRTLTAAAAMQKGTLVCTLHHVEMALKHFPRILGLRDGQLHFDLPAHQVSPEQLAQLYAHREDELHLDPDSEVDLTRSGLATDHSKPLPAVMHCR
jgi:phosphonate transport system ATP-binding protein